MHHAYYIEGPLSLFEAYQEQLKPFWAKSVEKFGIDDARELIEQAQLKVLGDATFLIAVGSITSEAQQALLKLFEEPQPGLMFILILPHGMLIPTLRSRMLSFPSPSASKRSSGSPRPSSDELRARPFSHQVATTFIKASQKERSDYITKLLKDDDAARETVRELLNGLEEEMHKGLKKAKGDKAYVEALADIAQVRGYVGDRSPSLKMLLEHLALALPQI